MLGYLNLGSNSFLWGVPDWNGEMRWPSVLDLSANGFNGSVWICLDFGKLRFLHRLKLPRNEPVGIFLPQSTRNCTSMLELDFSWIFWWVAFHHVFLNGIWRKSLSLGTSWVAMLCIHDWRSTKISSVEKLLARLGTALLCQSNLSYVVLLLSNFMHIS